MCLKPALNPFEAEDHPASILQCWGQWHVLSYPVYAVLQIKPRASVNIRQALCLLSSLSSLEQLFSYHRGQG